MDSTTRDAELTNRLNELAEIVKTMAEENRARDRAWFQRSQELQERYASLENTNSAAEESKKAHETVKIEPIEFNEAENNVIENIKEYFPSVVAEKEADIADDPYNRCTLSKVENDLIIEDTFNASELQSKVQKLVNVLETQGIPFKNWSKALINHLGQSLKEDVMNNIEAKGAWNSMSEFDKWKLILIQLFKTFPFELYAYEQLNLINSTGIGKDLPLKAEMLKLIKRGERLVNSYHLVSLKLINWSATASPALSVDLFNEMLKSTNFIEMEQAINKIPDVTYSRYEICYHHLPSVNNPRLPYHVSHHTCGKKVDPQDDFHDDVAIDDFQSRHDTTKRSVNYDRRQDNFPNNFQEDFQEDFQDNFQEDFQEDEFQDDDFQDDDFQDDDFQDEAAFNKFHSRNNNAQLKNDPPHHFQDEAAFNKFHSRNNNAQLKNNPPHRFQDDAVFHAFQSRNNNVKRSVNNHRRTNNDRRTNNYQRSTSYRRTNNKLSDQTKIF